VTALAGILYLITGVLIVAGISKLIRPAATATALREMSIPAPIHAARLLGAFEVIVGVAAILVGSPILWALVAALYASFTIFVLWALQADSTIGSCGCFGQEDTPPTPGHAAFNAAAAAVSALAIGNPVRLGDFDGTPLEAVAFVSLICIGVVLAVLALTSLPRVLALANGTAKPVTPQFTLSGGRKDNDLGRKDPNR
jgi:hypothetical protein